MVLSYTLKVDHTPEKIWHGYVLEHRAGWSGETKTPSEESQKARVQ
jgi:hypothetical protein